MGQTMSDEWAPSTNGVRGMYLLGLQGARKVWEGPIISPKEAEADFDRWLAKHDAEVVKAERERDINLLEGWKERLTSMGWRIPSSSDLEKAKAVEYCVQLIERGN
jgi:hypothetical protein